MQNHGGMQDLVMVAAITSSYYVIRPLTTRLILKPFAGFVLSKTRLAKNAKHIAGNHAGKSRNGSSSPTKVPKEAWVTVERRRKNRIDSESQNQQQGLTPEAHKLSKSAEIYMRQEKKIIESAWKVLYYSVMWLTGVYLLLTLGREAGYLQDTTYYWRDYMNNYYPPLFKFWYLGQLSFYIYGLLSIHQDVPRSDQLAMTLHHLCTVSLIGFSWCQYFYRVGHMILVIHDIADIALEVSKLCRYARKEKAAIVSFASFVFIWVATRIVIFPWNAIYSAAFEPQRVVAMSESYKFWQKFFLVFLIALYVLHVYWTVIIFKILRKALADPAGVRDSRESDSEDEAED